MVRCTLDPFGWEKIVVCDEADASRDERCSGRGEMAQPLRSVASIPALKIVTNVAVVEMHRRLPSIRSLIATPSSNGTATPSIRSTASRHMVPVIFRQS